MFDSSLGEAAGTGPGDTITYWGDGSVKEVLTACERGGPESHVPLVSDQAGREKGEGEAVVWYDREPVPQRVVRGDPSRDSSPKRIVSDKILNKHH